LHKLSWIRLIKITAWLLIKLSKQPVGNIAAQKAYNNTRQIMKELQKFCKPMKSWQMQNWNLSSIEFWLDASKQKTDTRSKIKSTE